MSETEKIKTPQQLWEKISSIFVHFVERIFFVLGVLIAKNPWRTIAFSWIFVILSCGGLYKFYIEKNPIKLWVPPDSDFYHDTNWYIENFGTMLRMQRILITADNVLEPEVLFAIKNITKHVEYMKAEYDNKTYSINDLCLKVPIVNFGASSWKSRSDEPEKKNKTHVDYSDPSLWMDTSFYCSLVENFDETCLQNNVLDLWSNKEELLYNTTKNDIIARVNDIKVNPVTGHPYDYTKLLGGVEYDINGDIVIAKSILVTWYMYVNMTDVNMNEVGNLIGTEEWTSVPLALWEKKFLEYAETLHEQYKDLNFYYESGRSFADTSGEAMFGEMGKLFTGIFVMFIYVLLAISRWNWLEFRLTLGGVGLMSVGMAYGCTIGWCSLIGIPFGPVHSSLPFLLMGLGLDDMFVMNACWKIVVSSTDPATSLPLKIGHMLEHAGVSIVITSFTDIVALLVGAITILPSLKSFCLYAAMGVFFIFIFSVTFFVAVFTLDIKRIEARRNGVFFCYQHERDIKLSDGETFFSKILAKFYENIVFTLPGKIVIILFTLIVTGFSIESIFHLEQRFDPQWFIPDNTYYKDFLNSYEHYYPREGNPAIVTLGDMNYNTEFKKLHNMVKELKKESYVADMDSWVETFHQYVLTNYNHNLLNGSDLSDEKFNRYLSQFLFSPVGGKYQFQFRFPEPLQCGGTINQTLASLMSFTFPRFEGPETYIPAMHTVKDTVKNTNITTGSGYRSVWAKAFGNWATDEVIAVEVERNVELALLCVMLCTIVLITNIQMCLWIFICVLLTIINVLGFMQRWGMTVDIVCCIGLELAIGLCVDYAAHVGHTFLTIKEGTRNERALKTVTSIGTAVLLGGGSTFLSLSFLSQSKAYTFQSFFKIFFLVILFGLFNGLLFLPVVLSFIGPKRSSRNKADFSPEAVELNNTKNNEQNGL
ncbi:NPC intracellular cholesterol transporter 1-like [Aricia agestis]|uniref:NPC intracellular cholesterol transporter 1-like n=1 Tax=Aricia agestis TaxID=91739 RepID=UPI001C206CB7|nr:NPC intracellular cholesterol transporter 1-like [Aricia agestis]